MTFLGNPTFRLVPDPVVALPCTNATTPGGGGGTFVAQEATPSVASVCDHDTAGPVHPTFKLSPGFRVVDEVAANAPDAIKQTAVTAAPTAPPST
jgi:hypothetical protein